MAEMSIREQYRERLMGAADPGFREFNKRLLPGVEGVAGVRTPELRRLARELVRSGWEAYVREITQVWKKEGQGEAGVYHEEIILWALSVCGGCRDWDTAKGYAEELIPAINNWAACDIFCGSLKLVSGFKNQVWEFIQPYLRSDQEYSIRFGVVMLLSHFADQDHVGQALVSMDQIRHEGYYVKMAVAWAVSVYFVKCRDAVTEYLPESKLDDWTYNKALQKITESLRVDKDTKVRIRAMKRR